MNLFVKFIVITIVFVTAIILAWRSRIQLGIAEAKINFLEIFLQVSIWRLEKKIHLVEAIKI